MTTTQVRPWWATAPNPPCSSWCEGDHPEDEFTRGGSLLCRHVAMESERVYVEVWQLHAVTQDEGEPLVTDPAEVYLRVGPDTQLDPKEAQQVAAALMTAGRTAGEANR